MRRGGGFLKFKNLLTASASESVYKADEKFEVVQLDRKECTYSYFGDPMYVFMDEEYNQYEIEAESMGDALNYLEEAMPVEVVFYDGRAISVELPTTLAREPQHTIDLACPYGAPGDRLWVRETWSSDFARHYPYDRVWYAADDDRRHDIEVRNGVRGMYSPESQQFVPFRWRPSIHMPRSACRLVLEVLLGLVAVPLAAHGPQLRYRVARQALGQLAVGAEHGLADGVVAAVGAAGKAVEERIAGNDVGARIAAALAVERAVELHALPVHHRGGAVDRRASAARPR
ncbi:hypothetical protein [Lactiplantibacillus plantarum]|uniref:hypothetical protein n=1 Tax=Lactiplantibacillus plantarum TaxID=1590 RepID=UPI0040452C65